MIAQIVLYPYFWFYLARYPYTMKLRLEFDVYTFLSVSFQDIRDLEEKHSTWFTENDIDAVFIHSKFSKSLIHLNLFEFRAASDVIRIRFRNIEDVVAFKLRWL